MNSDGYEAIKDVDGIDVTASIEACLLDIQV